MVSEEIGREFDLILDAMERLNGRVNPLYARRIGRAVDMNGREVGYVLRKLHADNRVICVDMSSFKKWRLP